MGCARRFYAYFTRATLQSFLTERQEIYTALEVILVVLLGTGLLSEWECLGRSCHAGSMWIRSSQTSSLSLQMFTRHVFPYLKTRSP